MRREIKDDVRKQHNLYVNNFVGDVKANPRDFYRYINSKKKDNQGIPPLKRRRGTSRITDSEIEQAEEFNGQFMDVFNKNEHSQVPFLSRSALFLDDVISKEGVTEQLRDCSHKNQFVLGQFAQKRNFYWDDSPGTICTNSKMVE